MRNLLLDTNALIAFFQGDSVMLDKISKADHVYLSAIVMGEFLCGLQKSANGNRIRNLFEAFTEASTVEILPVSEETADFYSRLFNYLKKQGRPIPTNDLWIAAQTLERGAVLATCDRHFQDIPNLRLDA